MAAVTRLSANLSNSFARGLVLVACCCVTQALAAQGTPQAPASSQTPPPAAGPTSPPAEELPRGRVVERVATAKDLAQTYALYLPSNYSPARRWPVLYCFDPGARG